MSGDSHHNFKDGVMEFKAIDKYFFILVTIFFLDLLFIGSANAESPTQLDSSIRLEVEKFKLDNGLTVLLHEDHSAPLVIFQQWFKVGSRNEKIGLTGLAHFFEHLMFKGTTRYPGNAFDKLIREQGGNNNAFTTRDVTGYYINLPSSAWPLAIELDSDRMRNLIFDQGGIDSEREVVKEERRFRVENEVAGLIEEKLWKTMFKVHPYSWPVIGSMVDLNRATIEDLKSFYNSYYSPNNAVVLLAGDFNLQKAKKKITEAYQGIQRQEIMPYSPPAEPPQTSERRAVIKKQVQNKTAVIAYRTIPAGHQDSYALDLVATVLGQGTSSRLYKKVIYSQQIASSIGAYSMNLAESGMFRIGISIKPGMNQETVFNSVFAEIFKLRTQKISIQELEKAKNLMMKDYVVQLKTLAGKSRAIIENEILFGHPDALSQQLEKYAAVKVEDIQKVVSQYLIPENRVVVWVEPEGTVSQVKSVSGSEEKKE